MKIKFLEKYLLKLKKRNYRLFQKKTWTWVVRLDRYDNNPTVSNYFYYCYLHYASCNAFKNYETANSYFDNMLLINEIKYSNINPLRFNTETETIKSFSKAFKNQNFKENIIHFLNADSISDTIILEFIKNNFYLKNNLEIQNSNSNEIIDCNTNTKNDKNLISISTTPILPVTILKENENSKVEVIIDDILINEVDTLTSNSEISSETGNVIENNNNALIKTEEHLETKTDKIKVREGVDLRTYKIVWEMRDKNPTNDLNLFKNKLEYETAFRLWMKDTFGVNTMEKETILDNWNFSYKNKIIELKEKGKSLFYLGTQLRQIIKNDDIFDAIYVTEAKKILDEFSL